MNHSQPLSCASLPFELMQSCTACDRYIAAKADVDCLLDVDLPQELSVEPDSYDSD